jgi:hypothetical protein
MPDLHPTVKMNFRIYNDRHVRMNNLYIQVENGNAESTDQPSGKCQGDDN